MSCGFSSDAMLTGYRCLDSGSRIFVVNMLRCIKLVGSSLSGPVGSEAFVLAT